MKKRIFALVMTAAMGLGLLAGCAPADKPVAGAVPAFKLGATGPLTGSAAIYGTAAQNGAQIAVDEISALGGIQFDLKYQDDANDAEKAVYAYSALKDWGMQISLGSVTTKPCEATSTDTFADRIFALTPSASAPTVIAGKDNMYQMCFSDTNQGSASAQYIADQKLGTKIAVIYMNDDPYSTGIYNTFKSKASELNLNIVSESTFATGNDTDFNVQLTDAKAKGADLIFLPMYYTPASMILSQARAMEYTPKFFGVDGMDGILGMKGFDTTLAEGVMLLTPFNADATDSRTTTFVKTYQEKFQEVPNQFAADGYDCIYAYKTAIEAAGVTPDMSADVICEKLVAVFPTIALDGLTGEGMTWDATGAVAKAPKGMVIQNGGYVGM